MEPDAMDLASVRVQGLEAVYAVQGTGHPVLFIHGWGATHRFWRYQWPEVSSTYLAMAPDLPGWGLSEKPDVPYTLEWYADWLDAFLDRLGIASAAVVGHSFGASIAIQLAASHPQRVSHLLAACPIIRGSDALYAETRVLSLPGLRHLAYPLCKSLWFLRFVTRNFTYARRPDEADILAIASGTYASLSRPLTALKDADLTPRLSEVRCPTLVVGCEEDLVVRPGQARVAAERIPGARLEMLEGCGHLVMIEAPEEFNGRLVRFLRDHRLNLVGRRPPQW